MNDVNYRADCLKEIKQSYNEETKNFLADYQPSKDVFFSKKSLRSILLSIYIYEEVTIEKPWDMIVTAYDPGIA
jgi:hypothetical protein